MTLWKPANRVLEELVLMELLKEGARPKRWSELWGALKDNFGSKTTLSVYLKGLKSKGLIKRIEKGRKNVCYKLPDIVKVTDLIDGRPLLHHFYVGCEIENSLTKFHDSMLRYPIEKNENEALTMARKALWMLTRDLAIIPWHIAFLKQVEGKTISKDECEILFRIFLRSSLNQVELGIKILRLLCERYPSVYTFLDRKVNEIDNEYKDVWSNGEDRLVSNVKDA